VPIRVVPDMTLDETLQMVDEIFVQIRSVVEMYSTPDGRNEKNRPTKETSGVSQVCIANGQVALCIRAYCSDVMPNELAAASTGSLMCGGTKR
jgi:hypothetical protein